ncbi:MAG: hypothetical protein GY847_03645 [Proteobacteria bacterium]|nr:hypothetical protein [Pseudomonadota bacterium]
MPYKKVFHILLRLVPALVFEGACTNIGDYSTGHGECYEGSIVRAEYVRSEAFDPEVRLELTLDANSLGQGKEGATITTNDGTFDRAPVSQMTQLAHDSLSLLQFPGGRVRNYLAHASPSNGSPATIVISLMENDEVEVRILRPDLMPDDSDDSSLFGVFRLVRREEDDCDEAAAD